ncbi:large ribosomal subunit protein mL41-like [Ornithodoros turicata]|uniref:large ribosomal subunit protein mL41-like n=1 Tax=Ornithodoros turicata TaxID=34597 RepID=UPI0031395AE6
MSCGSQQIRLLWHIQRRAISTSGALRGKRNFRKFQVHNIRGNLQDKNNKAVPRETYGKREPVIEQEGKSVFVPELVPELVVPDLTGFELKPYVSYRAAEVTQGEFTARDLFDAIYSEKVSKAFEEGIEDEEAHARVLSEHLTKEEAWKRAHQTGSDIFPADCQSQKSLKIDF